MHHELLHLSETLGTDRQLLHCELPDRLQHGVAGLTPALAKHHRRIHESRRQLVGGANQAEVLHQAPDVGQPQPGGKHRHRLHQAGTIVVEESERPLDGGPEALLSLDGVDVAAAEPVEALIESLDEIAQAERAQATRGELNSEREPIELAAELGDLDPLIIRDDVETTTSARCRGEQLEARPACSGFGRHLLGDDHRLKSMHTLETQPERLSAGSEHLRHRCQTV